MPKLAELKVKARSRFAELRLFIVKNNDDKKIAEKEISDLDSEIKSLEGSKEEGAQYVFRMDLALKNMLSKAIGHFEATVEAGKAVSDNKKKVVEKKAKLKAELEKARKKGK